MRPAVFGPPLRTLARARSPLIPTVRWCADSRRHGGLVASGPSPKVCVPWPAGLLSDLRFALLETGNSDARLKPKGPVKIYHPHPPSREVRKGSWSRKKGNGFCPGCPERGTIMLASTLQRGPPESLSHVHATNEHAEGMMKKPVALRCQLGQDEYQPQPKSNLTRRTEHPDKHQRAQIVLSSSLGPPARTPRSRTHSSRTAGRNVDAACEGRNALYRALALCSRDAEPIRRRN